MASWHDFDDAAERRDANAGIEYERAWEAELDRRAEAGWPLVGPATHIIIDRRGNEADTEEEDA